jgi:hypothetical protein
MIRFLLSLLLATYASVANAGDELVTVQAGESGKISYILTTNAPQKVEYAVILMPGGRGILDPRLDDSGRITMTAGGNFLIRSRALFADAKFVAASTDATTTPGRIAAIIADLEKRFGPLQVYVVGTSRSTEATMKLARSMDGQVAGFVHSSSMNGISGFDPRQSRSRNLIVYHDNDRCRVTSPTNGQASHDRYGTDLIVMTGGKSTGDECEAFAHHGYNGIEAETVDKIKAWIVRNP